MSCSRFLFCKKVIQDLLEKQIFHVVGKQNWRHNLILKIVSIFKIQIVLIASLLKSAGQLFWASTVYLYIDLNEMEVFSIVI